MYITNFLKCKVHLDVMTNKYSENVIYILYLKKRILS